MITGSVCAEAGRCAALWVAEAVRLVCSEPTAFALTYPCPCVQAQSGHVEAVCTAPVNRAVHFGADPCQRVR
jgi:hypothetical protein